VSLSEVLRKSQLYSAIVNRSWGLGARRVLRFGTLAGIVWGNRQDGVPNVDLRRKFRGKENSPGKEVLPGERL
jgi:hypothetical protein